MATIEARVKKISVYSNGENIRYRVTFDQSFDAIVKNADGKYVEAQANYVDFIPIVLISQILDSVEGLDILYVKKKEEALRSGASFGFSAELNLVLRNAKMVLERKKFEAGDEYEDADGEQQVHEFAGYRTTVSDIKITDVIQAKLDAMLDKMFDI